MKRTVPEGARVKLDRPGVFGLLANLLFRTEGVPREEVTEETFISDPDVCALLGAMLTFREDANFNDACLRWTRGATVGSILDALGLTNGQQIPRKETRGRKPKEATE